MLSSDCHDSVELLIRHHDLDYVKAGESAPHVRVEFSRVEIKSEWKK